MLNDAEKVLDICISLLSDLVLAMFKGNNADKAAIGTILEVKGSVPINLYFDKIRFLGII